MPHEDALHASLRYLYNEASKFHVSIDIIVKLAKSLKLDTFVDAEETPGVQRLSIAGSLLLLEIDFSGDHTVTKVSLSLGNHTLEIPAENAGGGKNIVSESFQNAVGTHPAAKSVVLSFLQQSTPSFLQTAQFCGEQGQNAVSVAENILLASLAGPTLGTFPENLKYLADIDRVSPPEADLIVYMDNLATYLSAIHHTETQICRGDWQVSNGFTSTFGEVLLNDERGKHVGVFLQFWQASRFLNRELGQQNGIHTVLLAIEESKTHAVDYVAEAAQKPWVLQDSLGNKNTYFFQGESDSAHLHGQQSVIDNAFWNLVLRFTQPVFLQKTILEYLGISEYESTQSYPHSELWKNTLQDGEICFKANGKDVVFLFEEPPQYVCLRAVSLDNLHILESLMPVIRNQLVLTKLIESVAGGNNTKYYRGIDTETVRKDHQKMRASLQISNDVPEEELLSLSTISNDYVGTQMLERELELGDLAKSESEAGDDTLARNDFDTESSAQANPRLQFTVQEIIYGQPELDYVVKITGNLALEASKVQLVDTQVRIHNGKLTVDGEDMNMDTETDVSGRFVHALALSEDVLLALETI